MAILSDKDIKKALKDGNIICDPFNEKNLGTSSYDVTLGEYYYEWDPNFPYKYYNPYISKHVENFWTLKQATNDPLYNDKCNVKTILIPSRQTILAHTNEFIGGLGDITTKMQCRSSYGRNCITVCKCSGLGDNGYISRWCMEIENCGPFPVVLTVGERIAQISFLKTGEVEKQYTGSYQSSYDIDKLKKEWKPEMLLPKLKYD